MQYILRPYQKRVVASVLAGTSQKIRPVVVMPGGGGKTPSIAELVRIYVAEGKRILVVSHRKEIINQIREHLRHFGISDDQVGMISAKLGKAHENHHAPVQIASKDTVVRRIPLRHIDVVIVDECHHVVAKGYKRLIQQYPDAYHIGFTATPIRYDGRGLDEWYTDLIMGALPSELVEGGYLAAPRVFTVADEYLPDLSHVPVKYGEYSTKHLANEMSRKGLAGSVVQNYLVHGKGKTFVGFSVTIDHSIQLVNEFKAHGIPVAHVDGTTDDDVRDQLLDDIRTGKLLGIFNCMLLCEGWDFPGCEMVIMARPTHSLSLFLQQASRGMRPLGDKKPIILDHARNTIAFGMPHADRYYTLHGLAPQAISAPGPTKVCKHCYAVVDRLEKICPECGEPFGHVVALPVETTVLLEELTKKRINEFRDKLVTRADQNGWDQNWVEAVLSRWLTTKGIA